MKLLKSELLGINRLIGFLFIISFFCNTVKAQNSGINIDSEDISIQQVFDLIEAHTSYTVAFNRTRLDINKKLSLSVHNADIHEILSIILDQREWTYYLQDKHIIIAEKDHDSDKRIRNHIRGKVYDKLTGLPVPYARVILLNDNSKTTVTDENGLFVLNDLPIGRYDIQVLFMGYKSFIYHEVVLTSAKEPFIEIPLSENLYEINEVVVKSQNNKDQTLNPMVLAGGRMVSVEEASRYAGGFDDPARLVTSFAGVSGGIGDNSLAIHGNSPHLLQWKLEGIEIDNPNHFADLTTMGGGIFSSLSSNVLGNSDFLTGAYPSEYNNAFSGVFDMKLRNGNNQHYEHSVQASIIGIDIASEGPLNKGKEASYLFNYRNASFALIKEFIPDMEINNFGYQDLSFKIHLPSRDKGVFSIWGLGLVDNNYEKIEKYPAEWGMLNDKKNITGDQYMASGGIGHNYFFNEKSSLKTSLGIVYVDNDLVPDDTIVNYENPYFNLKNRSYRVSINSHINYKVSPRHTNKSGITWTSMFYDIFYNERNPYNIGIIQNKLSGTTYNFSAFSSSLFQLNERIRLSAGISSQFFQLNKNWAVEPRLGIDYLVSSNHSIAFAYGLHSRMEKLTTYFIETYDDPAGASNRDLDFIRANQFIISYKWKISPFKIFKISSYYHVLSDIPMVPETNYSTLNGLSFLINVPLENEGKGINKGIDLTFERYLSDGYYYLLTGSIYDSRYRAKDGPWLNTKYNYRFLFNVLGGREWIFGKKNQHSLNSNIKFSFRGGDRYTPVNVEESEKEWSLVTYEDRIYEKQFSPKLKIDFTISYKYNTLSTGHEFAFKILNMTGVSEYLRHRFDYDTNSIVEDKVKIVLPNLSYKFNF